MKIFKDSNDKYCLAKVCYVCVLTVFTCVITYKELGGLTVDYSGMSLFLAGVAATYFGRSYTKAKGVL